VLTNTNGFLAQQNNSVNIDYVTYRLPNLAAFRIHHVFSYTFIPLSNSSQGSKYRDSLNTV
jgi:hypothetical protein